MNRFLVNRYCSEVRNLSVTKNDLYKMIDKLNDADTTSAFDYLQYLVTRSMQAKNGTWAQLAQLPPDDDPFNEEERRQFAAPEDYISIKQAEDEYDI